MLTGDLDILQDVAVGQCEAGDVFGLPQVAVQAVAEVHHVVLCGVDLPEGGAQRAAPPLKAGLLAAPLLLQPCLLLLRTSVPAHLGTLGALVCIFRPEGLCVLPQELGKKEFRLQACELVCDSDAWTCAAPVFPGDVCAGLSETRTRTELP